MKRLRLLLLVDHDWGHVRHRLWGPCSCLWG